jgi:hypothetical protein
MARTRRKPRCIIIAGPNGAGKTTFARDYLPGIARLIHFVNADLIAGGISPLRPELRIPNPNRDCWSADRLDVPLEHPFMLGVRNRIATLTNWFWAYLKFGGSIRLITGGT